MTVDAKSQCAIVIVSMEIQKQELKQILTGQRKEYERYIGALKEDFDTKVEAIGEQYSSIQETLASHTKMIASTKEGIEVMKIDIAFIKAGLKQKVDVEEFETLERRVALLEAKSR